MPRKFKVTVNGREYDVTVLELTAGQSAGTTGNRRDERSDDRQSPQPAARRPPRQAASRACHRPAAAIAGSRRCRGRYGRRRRRSRCQGRPDGSQSVTGLLVLEAMKMKTPVIATRGGQVSRVLVAPGDSVEGGQPLVTIA
jgi:hypothetical protein